MKFKQYIFEVILKKGELSKYKDIHGVEVTIFKEGGGYYVDTNSYDFDFSAKNMHDLIIILKGRGFTKYVAGKDLKLLNYKNTLKKI